MKNMENLVEFGDTIMIYFLYGQDTYRSKKKLEEIIEHYRGVHKSGLNLRFFGPLTRLGAGGQNLNYQEFKDEFQQMPMFKEKKLLVMKNVFQNQEFKNSFLENSKKFVDSKDIIIFHEEEDISPKDSLFKFLTKNAKTQEFQLLEGEKLKNWAKKELEKYKTEIQPEALSLLLNYVSNDLWRLSNEIQKLSAFKKGKTIESKDVCLLVKPLIETDIFKTIEALASKNKKKAISLLHEHLEKGDSPLYLLTMINFQFRNLLLVKETGRLKSHPYFARKMAWLARGFTVEELKKIYRKIFEADLKIKTGRLDPQTALDLLITEI